jgi:predicted Zn finger-like uncharacterized protein
MLVQCPNCDTKYELDESLLGRDGARVRCTRCSHVFSVNPEPPEERVSEDSDFDWLKDMEDIDQQNIPKAREGRETSYDEDFPETTSVHKHDTEISLDIQPSSKPRSKALNWLILGIFILAIALGGFVYSRQITGIFGSWLGSTEETAEEVQPPPLGPDEADLISLQNVRQYFVTNEKIGQLFVIEGKARNDFPQPMELIKIEASLFDAAGQPVQSKEFLAGNTVSLFQLQVLSEEELEKTLQAKVGILSNNTNIRPGMDVSFMVVFPNPDESVQEYGLKVIEVQYPPK